MRDTSEPAPAPAAFSSTVRRPLARARAWFRSHRTLVTVAGSLIVAVALVVGLWDKRGDFAAAFGDASLPILGAAVLLQVVWLIARSEAWHVCVSAAGGNVKRRRLYRAASVGYLGNLFLSLIHI